MRTDQPEEEDDVQVVPMELPLDAATTAWLARLARVTGAHPNEIVASMLRDIRLDDEQAHEAELPSSAIH